METKDLAHTQTLLKLEHYKKLTEEFSVLLKNTELERDKHIEECNEVKNQLNEVESKLKQQVEAEEHEDEKSYEGNSDNNFVDSITIPIEEYNSLVQKADQISKSPVELDSKQRITESENENEVIEVLKKELEVAKVKIGMLRNRAEQAATRAEAAEKAKATVEEQLRKWKEQRRRRKAALAALREESAPKRFGSSPTIEKLPAKNQPLGKVLKMKI